MSEPVLPNYLTHHVPSARPDALIFNKALQSQLIRGVTAEKIDSLCLWMATKVGEVLGGNLREAIVYSVNSKKCIPMETWEQRIANKARIETIDKILEAKIELEKGNYFTEEELEYFASWLKRPLVKDIQSAFSSPDDFLENGLAAKIDEVLQRIKYPIPPEAMPREFSIRLSFNRLKTQAELRLIFQLDLFSEDVRFRTVEFAIAYLKGRAFF